MNRKEFFNSMADSWDAKCRHDRDTIHEILGLLPIRTGDSVLDVGTGTGILIPFLLERIGEDGHITAVDMAENMIRMAQAKLHHDNLRFVASDVFTANLPLSAYDLVICYSVFPHFEDKNTAVSLLARHLNAGGVIAICHAQGRDTINKMHKTISPAVADDHLPTSQEIAEYLDAAGCTIVTLLDTERLFVVAGRKGMPGDDMIQSRVSGDAADRSNR